MPISMKMVNLPTAPRDKYIESLAGYTKGQLMELKDRQSNLISNKSFLSKLPDKGVRLQTLYDKILVELKSRDDIDLATELFSELNLVEKGKKTLNQMEWNGGKTHGDHIIVAADTLDSDDDEIDIIDPLKIIAQSRDIKLVKVQKPAKSLITEADLADIKSMADEAKEKVHTNTPYYHNSSAASSSDASTDLDQHAIYLMKLEDDHRKNSAQQKERFLPFRTTKNHVHDADKERCRPAGKKWENTAATPPLIRNDAVKLLSLQESIDTERKQQEALRDQLEQQAQQRLEARRTIVANNISLLPPGSECLDPNSFFRSYRQQEEKNAEDEEDSLSEHSALDEDEEYDSDHGGVSVAIRAFDN